MKFKFKIQLTQEIKIHHHQQEWNLQILKFIKKKVKFMVTIMDGALIKGENKVVKLKEKLHKLETMMDPFNVNLKHHTQEYITWFNGIILSTTYLGVSRGVTTRSRLSNFCAFYSFVSSLEPLSVEQALEDPD
jgi:hypothetical protein